jgi:hypothetical protein
MSIRKLRIPSSLRLPVPLLVLLLAGLAVRIYFLVVWRPAITGYSDSGIYFQDSVQSLWTDPIRTVGYSMFLRVLHGISPHLIFVIIVQHLLGLVTASLYFFAVRRAGGPRLLGLAPAAMIAFGGDQLFMEHSALSDSLLIFIVSVSLYCAVRGAEGKLVWAALAGFFAGLGVWDRGAGLAMVVVIAGWLLFSRGRPTRATAVSALLALILAVAMIGAYVGWRESASGLSGLTTNNAWNLYGRVAPWADCNKFKAPAGTDQLCEYTTAAERGYRSGGDGYIYNTDSPAWKLFGPPYEVSKYPHAMSLLEKWSEAAIIGQPGEYLNAVWLDTLRLFDPNHASYSDLSADELIKFLVRGPNGNGENEFVSSWEGQLYPGDPPPHHGEIGPLEAWEKLTRLTGIWMALALSLCLIGPWVLSGRARSAMILFALASLALLFFPILTKGYDYRFVIQAFGPLVAAGALALWGLQGKIRGRRRPAPALIGEPRGGG